MSKEKTVRNLILNTVIMLSFNVLIVSNVYAADTVQLGNANQCVSCSVGDMGGQNEIMSAKLVWHFKKINGKTYRRLYDATNGVWLTDWILC